MSKRTDALQTPVDPEWRPHPGEIVFIAHGSVAYAEVVAFVAPHWALVKFHRAGKWERIPVSTSEIRPTGRSSAHENAARR
jgi:hypothetical protein